MLGLLVSLLMAYVVSYVVWTRAATLYWQTQEGIDNCYYFIDPSTMFWEKVNAGFILFYRPLIEIERAVGIGPRPMSPYMEGLDSEGFESL